MEVVEIFIRIGLAIIIGGFIGYEREIKNRPAGFSTHILVCVGATVVGLIQVQMIHDTIILINSNPNLANALKADIGRVVAQVVTGVGFLGAGTIMVDKGAIKGLTTATTLWVVACIGIAVGLGYYEISIVAAIMVIFIMHVLKRLEIIAKNRKFKSRIEVSYEGDNPNFIEDSVEYFRKNKLQIRDIKYLEKSTEKIKVCVFIMYTGKIRNLKQVVSNFANRESVISVSEKQFNLED